MATIRRILCPVDFSRCSRRALEQAVALAREFDAEITAMHSVVVGRIHEIAEIAPAAYTRPNAFGCTLESDRIALTAVVRDFLHDVEAAGVPIRITIAHGDAVDAIAGAAGSWGADLIVMGSRGRSGFDRLVLGSVVEKVLRRATCPVLTVPRAPAPPVRGSFVGRILCPLDFSPASLRGLNFARTLAVTGRRGIDVLTVVEPFDPERVAGDERPTDPTRVPVANEGAAFDRLRDAMRGRGRARCDTRGLVAVGTPCREILRVATEERSGVIVLGVAARSAADPMLFGATTQHVLRRAACPVLTVRG